MINRFSFLRILILLVVVVEVIMLISLPFMHDENDSSQYFMNVHFVQTGNYIIESSYPSFHKPSQIYPLLGYSGLVLITKVISDLSSFPWPFVIKFIQSLFFFSSAWLFMKISFMLTGRKTISELTGIFFLLYFPHFNFVTLLMSETYAIFLLALIIYLFLISVIRLKNGLLMLFFIIAGHAILVKPVYLPFILILTSFYMFYFIRLKVLSKKIPVVLLLLVFPFLQTGISEYYYGNPQIRKGSGWNLWNRVIAFDKLYPSSVSLDNINNIFKDHRQTVPSGPWWEITTKLSQFGFDEDETQQLCKAVAVDGIKQYPFLYFKNTFINSYHNFLGGMPARDVYLNNYQYLNSIHKYRAEISHLPLTTELLKQANLYTSETTPAFAKANYYFSKSTDWLSILINNIYVLITFILITLILIFRSITVKRKRFDLMLKLIIPLAALTVMIGSNLFEMPQSRLILPAMMYVVMTISLVFSKNSVHN